MGASQEKLPESKEKYYTRKEFSYSLRIQSMGKCCFDCSLCKIRCEITSQSCLGVKN